MYLEERASKAHGDQFPSLKVRFQCGQHSFHGFPPFFSMRTVDGLGVSGTVGGVLSRSGCEDVRLNIRDSDGIRVICKVGMEVSREGGKKSIAMGGTETGPIMLEESKLREVAMLYVHGGMALGVVDTNVGHSRRKLSP